MQSMPLDQVLQTAEEAFHTYKKASAQGKANFLRAIATEIEQLGEELLQVASQESNLPLARLTGERGRTMNQLKAFADLLEQGGWLEATIDPALPDRLPLPRPDLRRMLFPLGPVVVFGASNFPLAFSTAGGDSASALAAGCPVVYKEHPGHPKTSQLVFGAIQQALGSCGLPAGVFQHVSGGIEVGQELVKHPKTKAVAFTGSYRGGKAIFDQACQREQPIPVYAEMGSINPIFVLPGKAEAETTVLAEQAAASVLQGVGQFCTCPGLVFYPQSSTTEAFLELLSQKLGESAGDKMLHEGISKNYYQGLTRLLAESGVETLVTAEEDVLTGHAALARTNVQEWLKNTALQEEVFGPFTLVVTYSDMAELEQAAEVLQGQLTCTIWGTTTELAAAGNLVDTVREKCGRLLFAGVPTGVEVSPAMTHGGPFPATSDSRSTSVGTNAIKRFARPITFQSAPQDLLPDELKDQNPLSIWRTVDGQFTKDPI